MYNFKPVDTPVEKGLNLRFDECPKTDDEVETINNVSCACIVGSLM